MENQVKADPKTNALNKKPFFTILLSVLITEIISAIYLIFSVFFPSPFNSNNAFIFLFFILLTNLLFFIFVYRNWAKIGIRLRILYTLWSSIVLWYWIFSPVFFIISTNFTQAQLKAAFFNYFWEVPVVGGFFIIVSLIYFQPAFNYLAGKKSNISNPQECYDFLHKFSERIGIFLAFIALFGFSIGALQEWVLAQMPLVEQVKLIFHGITLGIFSGLYVTTITDIIFNDFRYKLKIKYPAQKFSSSGLSTKIVRSSLVLSVASIMMLSITGVRLMQNIIRDNVKHNISVDFTEVFYCINNNVKNDTKSACINTRVGNLTTFFEWGKDSTGKELLAPETISYINSHSGGEIEDSRKDLKIIGFRENPITLKKVVVITNLTDYYNHFLNSVNIFIFTVAIIIIITVLIIGIFTNVIKQSVLNIKKAINDGDEDIINLKIATGDEFEELAYSLSAYARQARDSRVNLEEKVEKKTEDLSRKVEELEKFQVLTVGRELRMIELKKEIEQLKNKGGEEK